MTSEQQAALVTLNASRRRQLRAKLEHRESGAIWVTGKGDVRGMGYTIQPDGSYEHTVRGPGWPPEVCRAAG